MKPRLPPEAAHANRAMAHFLASLHDLRMAAATGLPAYDLRAAIDRATADLDSLDVALLALDPRKHRDIFRAAPDLRATLTRLHDELLATGRTRAQAYDRTSAARAGGLEKLAT